MKSFLALSFKTKCGFSNTSYSIFNSYKCDYGQGGTLNLSLQNHLYDMKLETIWDDYTEIQTWKKPDQPELNFLTGNTGLKNSVFHISDENYKPKSIKENDNYEIKIKLPEYYSYNILLNGSLEHLKGYVDAKTYGNVVIKSILEKGEIILNKIKSETCSLQTLTGKIDILSSLEAQNANISTDKGEINIKKLGLTSKGYLFSSYGNITIGSIYGDVKKEKNTEQIDYDEVSSYIHKSNFLSINTLKSNIKIGNAHGNLIVQCIEGNIDIKRFDGNQLLLENEKGDIKINIVRLKENSVIKLNDEGQLHLNISSLFEGNIFFIDHNAFWKEKPKKEGVPTIFIKGKISDKNLTFNEKNDILSFLKT